jgi:hypothetical protein
MISKCANPACSAHFLYLKQGKVFRVFRSGSEPRKLQLGIDPTVKKHMQVEFYWLCAECSQRMTVCCEPEGGVSVKPLFAALRAAS